MKKKWWYFPVGLGGAIILICGVLTCLTIVNAGAFIVSSSHKNKADSYYDNGEYEEAIKWYDRALKLRPVAKGLIQYRKAEALSESGRFEEALEVYDEVLAHYAGDDFIYLVYYGKAEALAELGRFEEAAEAYGCAIDHPPVWEAARDPWDTGMERFEEERYVEAIAYFEAEAQSDPYDYNPYYMIGGAWLALGRYEKAASYFDVVSELAPAYAPARERKGWALGLMGRYEAALECADRALALDADDPDAWNSKGKILLLKGDAGAARECFDRALTLYPSSPEALLSKATTYFAEGKYDEARPYFEELSVAGGNPYYLLYLYLVDRAEGRPGTDRLQPLLESPPDNGNKKLSLFLVGRISAEDLLTKAGDNKSLLCEAHCYIGYKNKLDGDRRGARRHFKAAVATEARRSPEFILAQHELRRLDAAGE